MSVYHVAYVTDKICKNTFKGLREKYLRVRLKQDQLGPQWSQWEHFEALQFLEPHIVPRRGMITYCSERTPSTDSSEYMFSKDLINLVYNCKPLWAGDSHDKSLKMQFWHKIAKDLGVDVGVCRQKWKGLREKYIRQKQKYQEGREKWEFLDDLSFLDNMINYRKKHWQILDNYSTDSQFDQFSDASDQIVEFFTEPKRVKLEEGNGFSSTECNYVADSTLDGNRTGETLNSSRKRSISTSTSECWQRNVKTPEEIFGEFVAATLAKKSEGEKNSAMVKIMTILTEIH